MTDVTAKRTEGESSIATHRATVGLVVSLALVGVAFGIPPLLGWDVFARLDGRSAAPLHGFWEPKVGLGTVPALVLAGLAVWRGERWALTWSWRRLLWMSYAAALAWLLSLALVDGADGLTRAVANDGEYLYTAHQVHDVGLMLRTYVSRIPYSSPHTWPLHVSGHPPGAVLMFIGLVAIGLGGDLAAGLAVTVVAASMPAAVLVAMRTLGAERQARLAAPFLVFTPAAIYMGVSTDALFTVIAAWGLAALAAAGVARRGPRMVALAVVAGLLLGWCVMSSYGLPLLAILALAVLVITRSWWPLPIAALTALAVVLGFAAAGFAWWEAYPVLTHRYWDGIASDRPAAYWMWGNIAALLVSAGPMVGAGLAHATTRTGERRDPGTGPVLIMVGAAALVIALADLSQMSKAEVERIWLPFIPWLTLSLSLLPVGWRRWGLALQVISALVVQHLLYTSW